MPKSKPLTPEMLAKIKAKSEAKPKPKIKTEKVIGLKILDGRQLKSRNKQRCMKFQGFSGSGKSWLVLDHMKMHLDAGVSPEKILMCIIDYDVDGITDNLDFVDDVLLDRLKFVNCSEMQEGYAAVDMFIKMIKEHLKEHPDAHPYTYLVHENENMFYQSIKSHYSETMYGFSVRDWLTMKRKKEIRIGKSAMMKDEHPRDVQGPINRHFIDYFIQITRSAKHLGFNVITTTTLRNITKNWGMKDAYTIVEPGGRADLSDYWYSYIFTVAAEKEITKSKVSITYSVITEKLRGSYKPFRLPIPTAASIWKNVRERTD